MTGALADNLLGASHPYYPVDLKLPGYVPPLLPFKVVLAIFFSASALLLVVSWIFTGDDSCLMPTDTPGPSENVTAQFTGRQRHFHTVDRILFCWFALTGVIHFVVEGNKNLCGRLLHLLIETIKSFRLICRGCCDLCRLLQKRIKQYIIRNM